MAGRFFKHGPAQFDAEVIIDEYVVRTEDLESDADFDSELEDAFTDNDNGSEDESGFKSTFS